MEKLGQNLNEVVLWHGKVLSLKTVCMIGIQLLDSLKIVHELGFLHLDIKPENMMVDKDSDNNLSVLRLIDFGISKRFLDSKGEHVSEQTRCQFSGSLLFASKTAFEQK